MLAAGCLSLAVLVGLLVIGATRGPGGRLRRTPAPGQAMTPSQREAGDFFPHDGCDIVLVSEQTSVWL